MNVFGRRPLCIFCFLFFITALLVYGSEVKIKLAIGIVAVGVSFFCFLLSFLIKKHKSSLIILTVCLIGILLSLLNSYVRIDQKQKIAETYMGERSVIMTVIAQDNLGKESAEYLVDVSKIEIDSVSFRCLLFCSFATELSPGDQVYAKVELVPMSNDVYGLSGYQRTSEEGLNFVAILHDESSAMVRKVGEDPSLLSLLFRPAGLQVVTQRVKTQLTEYIDQVFDSEISALVKSFFVSDTSSVSSLTMRDFRRCGISHLMSVSGLHFSILLGMVDWLLRLFRLPKSGRCVLSAILAVIFLLFTGFALSACRSALMVIMVYFNFLLMEDHDSPTALFVSMAVIVFVSPHSIVDLGLWMSFLATLGLVTVFPWVDSHIPYPTKRPKHVKRILLLGRGLLQGLAITLIANLFLIPIYWVYFGEASVITVLVNLLVSPFAYWLLPMIVFALLCFNIPLVGTAFVGLVSVLCRCILWFAQCFSGVSFATISLNYAWADAAIPIFTLFMVIVLIIPLKKRKWLFFAPAALLAVCFTVFHIWLHLFGTPTLTYVQQQKADSLIIQEKGKTVVCSVSDGGRSESYLLLSKIRELSAVQIDMLILSHYDDAHLNMLTFINDRMLIDRLALPIPQNEIEIASSKKFVSLAEQYGIELIFFEEGTPCSVTKNVKMNMLLSTSTESKKEVAWSFFGKEKKIAYLNPNASFMTENLIENHQLVFFGHYGEALASESKIQVQPKNSILIFSHRMEKWEGLTFSSKENIRLLGENEKIQSITVDLS